MSDSRMITADEAKRLRTGITSGTWRLNARESVVGLKVDYWEESDVEVANVKLAQAAPDLAHTVIKQAETIERVRKALHRTEQADEQAQHDWDTKADMLAQGAAMGHSMAAQWLEEALEDTDDATNHTEQGEAPMSKTTQEWQQLLDGTTEGPWEWIDEPDDAHAQYIVDHKTGRMCLSVEAIGFGSIYEPSDPLLAAAAPEAVAEVIRLRKELEERIRVWLIVADKLDNRGLADEADFARIHTAELTSILDGDTNE